uniref:Uncharacterized protein n=1 Tax=Glossina palpalis gambiensis TaxID=67801 RepID=A0A1B0B404_9MUSC
MGIVGGLILPPSPSETKRLRPLQEKAKETIVMILLIGLQRKGLLKQLKDRSFQFKKPPLKVKRITSSCEDSVYDFLITSDAERLIREPGENFGTPLGLSVDKEREKGDSEIAYLQIFTYKVNAYSKIIICYKFVSE